MQVRIAEKAKPLLGLLEEYTADHSITHTNIHPLSWKRNDTGANERIAPEELVQKICQMDGIVDLQLGTRLKIPVTIVSDEGRQLKFGHIKVERANAVEVSGSDIRLVTISTGVSQVKLSNCRIGELRITSNRSASSDVVEIENCQIGRLRIGADVDLNTLIISGASLVGELALPSASKLNTRDIRIQEASFSYRDIEVSLTEHVKYATMPLVDRQSFSDLVTWAEDNKNSEVAHLARGVELGIENSQAKGLDKILLSVWKVYSEYGLKPARALGWLTGGMALLFVALCCLGTELAIDSPNGWQISLMDQPNDNIGIANIRRSFVATIQTTLAPWSIFGSGRLVVPEGWLGFAAQAFQSLYSILAILFAGFAVRRRFRMS